MATELGISTSAYSKIERGVTDPSIGRMTEIAKILEVSLIHFFQEETAALSKAEDLSSSYGFATKRDIEELVNIINTMKQEIAHLKTRSESAPVKKKKKL